MSSISSTTAATSTTSSLAIKTGISGLVSGLDTDTLVEQLTQNSRDKVLKQQQAIDKLEWKQTAYRSVVTSMKEFQSKYLDVLSTTNFGSASYFNTTAATASSEAVSVATNSSSYAGSFTINSITQLATNQKISSATAVSKALSSDISVGGSADYSALAASLAGKSIGINVNGSLKTITFANDFSATDAADFQTKMQSAIDTAFGIQNASDRLVSFTASAEGALSFEASGSSQITLRTISAETDGLSALGFSDAQSNKVNVSSEIRDLSLQTQLATTTANEDGVGTYNVTINGKDFSFTADQSITSIMNAINTSDAGVTLSYSSITDKFVMTSSTSGVGGNITIEENNSNLMEALGITGSNSETVYGQNAILTVDGQTVIRSSNDVSMNGVTVSLKETSAEAITVKMEEDGSSLLSSVKQFVEDYNKMIDQINTYRTEKVYKDYQPLTDAQRDEMTESQITKWEEKAKSGLLRNDSMLNRISSTLQTTMYSSENGFSLFNMGITTGGYTSNGKLSIDENKLKEALKTNGAQVRELFSSEGGLADKLNDAIDAACKTTGVKGQRGTLIEAAGYEGTMSDTENSISDSIKRYTSYMDTLKLRLEAQEKRYWNQFSALETAISNLNSQSSMLTQFGA